MARILARYVVTSSSRLDSVHSPRRIRVEISTGSGWYSVMIGPFLGAGTVHRLGAFRCRNKRKSKVAYLWHSGRLRAGVHNAEAVSVRVFQDHEVGVIRVEVPVHAGS